MKVKIELYGFLRSLLNSKEVLIEVPENSTLRKVLSVVYERIPELREAVEIGGSLKPYFMLFINDVDYELLNGYEYVVRDGDVIQLVPVSHGGSIEPLEEYINQINSMRVSVCLVNEEQAEELLSRVDGVSDSCVAQVLPLKYYYGKNYSALVAYLALRSHRLGLSVSRKKSLEFLLYYFGDRQISNVLKLLKNERSREYVAIYACLPEAAESEDSFSKALAKCDKTPEEPQKVPEEVLEKLASGIFKILS
ncbi:MAG: MoaD/ThiS family protein [Sulfolobales archaeon]|nr:MoaD/ThiS family protein [Sulfolobales archaeon]MCX8208217.1 MoaD/ThiS family protein [Sulfolobales archaeon]MDW8010631.1 MoaD/ThiS family protein [Sulfolobales archaeon]